MFSLMNILTYITTTFHFLHSITFALTCCFDISYADTCEMIFHCRFKCHFPGDLWSTSSFTYWTYFHLLWDIAYSDHVLIVNPVIMFILAIVRTPYIFWILIPYQVYGLQIFPQFHRLVLISLTASSTMQRHFTLM